MKRIALAMAAVLALGLLAGAEASTVPDGPRAIVVHCTIFNETMETNGSDADLLLIIGGEVRVDYVQLVSVRITLNPSNDRSWNCNVSPKEMTFTASSAQGFSANLTIPAKTYNTTCNLTIRADAIVMGLPADTSQDSIRVSVMGPSETPVIPPVKKPGGKGGLTPVNMPVVVFAISLAAIVGAFLTFALWKHKRQRRDKKDEKKKAKKHTDDEDSKEERAAEETDEGDERPAPRQATRKPKRPPAREDIEEEPAEEAAGEEQDEQPEEEAEEVVEVETEERRAKRGKRPKRYED